MTLSILLLNESAAALHNVFSLSLPCIWYGTAACHTACSESEHWGVDKSLEHSLVL